MKLVEKFNSMPTAAKVATICGASVLTGGLSSAALSIYNMVQLKKLRAELFDGEDVSEEIPENSEEE